MAVGSWAVRKINNVNKEVNMNLFKDLWGHLKEWSDWKLKDWIKKKQRKLLSFVHISFQ